MAKKCTFILGISFLFLGSFSLYGAHNLENVAQKVYDNYTLNNGNKVHNSVETASLEDEKGDFTENYTVIENKLIDKNRLFFCL